MSWYQLAHSRRDAGVVDAADVDLISRIRENESDLRPGGAEQLGGLSGRLCYHHREAVMELCGRGLTNTEALG